MERSTPQLILSFVQKDLPELIRIQSKDSCLKDPVDLNRLDNVNNSFDWSEVAASFSLLVIDYLIWSKRNDIKEFRFEGAKKDSAANSLANALGKSNHWFRTRIFQRTFSADLVREAFEQLPSAE